MKLKYTILFCALTLLSLGACKKEANELAHHHDHDHGHQHASHEGHSHNHAHEGEHAHDEHGHHHDDDDHESEETADVITLDPSVASRFGLSTEVASERPFNSVVKVAATVSLPSEATSIISAPSAGIVSIASGIEKGRDVKAGSLIAQIHADGFTGGDANRLAKIELDAAKAEFDRVESLYADRLVTLAEYNAALAAYERAKAAFSAPAAAGRVVSPIAGVITEIDAPSGSFVEVGSPIATVVSSSRLIIKGDVPSRSYAAVAGADDARIIFPDGKTGALISELGGARIGSNSLSAASGGYVPVSFSVDKSSGLVPGQTVEMYILGKNIQNVISVPVSAVSERQGAYFVYVRLDEDCYVQVPVVLGASDGKYVQVVSGLKGGENVVTAGVAAVRLAQTSGAVPEGHTHSH